jgi:hypothetical protein
MKGMDIKRGTRKWMEPVVLSTSARSRRVPQMRRGGGARREAGDVGAGCAEVEVGAGVVVSARTYMPPNSVLPPGERDCRHSLTRSSRSRADERPRASVTRQTKLLEESMPIATAVTYVLRPCREPIRAAITPPSVCVRSAFTHMSVSTASWFGDSLLTVSSCPYYTHSHRVVSLKHCSFFSVERGPRATRWWMSLGQLDR